MAIFLNGLKFFVTTAIGGKLIYIQHAFANYNRGIQEVLVSYSDAFSGVVMGAVPLF